MNFLSPTPGNPASGPSENRSEEPRFSNGTAKVDLFRKLPKLFETFFAKILQKSGEFDKNQHAKDWNADVYIRQTGEEDFFMRYGEIKRKVLLAWTPIMKL